MKKKIEAELISLAHKILQLKDSTTLPELQEHAQNLYEKLTILNFTETHFSGAQPTIGKVKAIVEESLEVQETNVVPNPEPILALEQEEKKEEKKAIIPILSLEEKEEEKTEKNTTPEAIDALTALQQDLTKGQEIEVAQKPEIIIEEVNARVADDLFIPVSEVENNKSRIEATVTTSESLEEEQTKSINDELKKGIHIGLNDRLAFIKHLFDGSSTDYNRVLSQLNTLHSKSGAREFIKTMVKPDYNEWEGKTVHEDRFMELIFRKYEF